ncbi:MAG TPA: phosphotransferase enzyme family protein [Bacteroidales bacterium]|nr:MAG: phosphotransferase enzyme family protein [Bacteroidetes bacterium GWF2_33_38]OFY72311.1 MAG: phosphotransferase enzyme family protein [Bacteroidetes bacterium RIFOXYA12_FULL_33_9]OFY85647.1 MAG: phosphotransferase enzyme family protein [Bacteroidetes bacterium RIFOXYA2_FULL_33_7]HBF88053.1 phosphotransferase enzyme family protein [Bacteroidales bacterium]
MVIKENLIKLFEEWSDEKIIHVSELPQHGSYRQYFRLHSKTKNVIGVYNADIKENDAFLDFSDKFFFLGLKVPQVYIVNESKEFYILEDLGDVTLFQYITEERKKNGFSDEIVAVYQKVLRELPKFQVLAANKINYGKCYPRDKFDKQSMMWDLNYFKYYFLKLAKVPFDEQLLEEDFQAFSEYLLKTNCDYFLYRDFQSRNIMLKDDKVYFIDYQGGRKGALQYDVASLLYDAKAVIPQEIRNELLEYYINSLSKLTEVKKDEFKSFYYGYVIIRILQAMGAYGFRGFYEKREHFLQSIPYALENLSWIIENIQLGIDIPHLWQVLKGLTESEELKKYSLNKNIKNNLLVSINSFSYRRGIPADETGNGGGFVFDCRSLNNPGRLDKYKNLTGKDQKVIDFFKDDSMMETFNNNVFEMVKTSVEKYMERGFTHLMINFGCTGGQHRSVYCAEKLFAKLKSTYNIQVAIVHTEREFDNLI